MLNEFNRIQVQLSRQLPGPEAQMKMAPVFSGDFNFRLPQLKAAVLVLLFSQGDRLFTILIKRTEYEGHYGGQISLPGGKYEPEDFDLSATSLRETAEETGINASEITMIGRLTTLEIPSSSFEVHPFVGYLEKKTIFSPDPKEVEYLIETDLTILRNERIKKKIMTIGEHAIEVPYYDYKGNHIWGATAMMLSEFLEVLQLAGL
ncbi:MAG TPA: CoA pyrophosphatase [Bacteroidales bacterium]|nr:CoA pyrophosphatase [Bacteroidales bacterium]